MKRSLLPLSLAVALGILAVPAVQAETVVTTTPGAMTYTGVVSEIDPASQVIILKSKTEAGPVTYTYTPQTVFLDTTGKTVSYETIRNVPVTVEYFSEGGRTVVRRVIANKPVRVIEERPVHVIEERR
jgi:hypothetical protein